MLTCRCISVYLAQIILSFVFLILASPLSYAGAWKAGTARVCITPQSPMPMAGFASRGAKHAEGKLTDLWAKAIVLEDTHGHQAALVTVDLLGIDRITS